MDSNEPNGKSEPLSVHWSKLSVQDRCNRLLNTLSQRKPGFSVSCSMCDNMKPSDRRTAHEVHFLSHHTIESDTKEEVFGYAGIPNLPTFDNAWQLSRNKIARRNKPLHTNVLTPPSEDCGRSFSTSLSSSSTTESTKVNSSMSQEDDGIHICSVSPKSTMSMPMDSQSISSSSINTSSESVIRKLSSRDGLPSDDSTTLNAGSSHQDTSNSLDANISLESRLETSLPEPLNFTSTLHNNSSIIMPNPIYQGIPPSLTSSCESFNENEHPSYAAVPLSASSSMPINACSVIKGPFILPRKGPSEGASSFFSPSSSSFTPASSNFANLLTSTQIETAAETSPPSQETESIPNVPASHDETAVSSGPVMKRKRGRPRKYFPVSSTSSANGSSADGTVVRRKRGRPRKYPPDLLSRNTGKAKNTETTVALKYTLTGEPVVVRRRGRPRKNAIVAENSSITIQKYTHSSQSKDSPLEEPCIQTRFMSEKARELFLKQCQVSFHSERSKKQQRLEEKRRRLNELLRMEKKLHSQLASELDSDLKSATDEAESENDFSSSDEDEMSTENESTSSITLQQLNNLDGTIESPSSLNLVPTTLPGIFFTNPNISIEVLPAARKNPTRTVRRHS